MRFIRRDKARNRPGVRLVTKTRGKGGMPPWAWRTKRGVVDEATRRRKRTSGPRSAGPSRPRPLHLAQRGLHDDRIKKSNGDV